jgi:hypothetical protein
MVERSVSLKLVIVAVAAASLISSCANAGVKILPPAERVNIDMIAIMKNRPIWWNAPGKNVTMVLISDYSSKD